MNNNTPKLTPINPDGVGGFIVQHPRTGTNLPFDGAVYGNLATGANAQAIYEKYETL